MTSTTTPVTTAPSIVRRRVTVATPPAVLFELLTDPTAHAQLDGTRSVKGVATAPDRLVLGSEFTMRMKGYTTQNRVVEYRRDELIAWRHRGRHIWRWELREVPGGTEVTQTFDYGGKRAHGIVRLLGIPRRADAALATTLDQLRLRFA